MAYSDIPTSTVVLGDSKLITSPALTVLRNSHVPVASSEVFAANVPPAGTAAVAVRDTQHQPVGCSFITMYQVVLVLGTVKLDATPVASVAE